MCLQFENLEGFDPLRALRRVRPDDAEMPIVRNAAACSSPMPSSQAPDFSGKQHLIPVVIKVAPSSNWRRSSKATAGAIGRARLPGEGMAES